MLPRLLPLSIASLLAGCASALNTADREKFSCPGMPAGVMCKSPVQVYRDTDGRDSLAAEPVENSVGPDAVGKPALQALSPPLFIASSPPASLPLPVLEPAKILRIWIAPWEDGKKDLHWPSYLFTEIQPRKWSFGKTEFTGSRPVVPHLMAISSAQPTVSDRGDSGRAGAVQPVSSPQAVTGIPEAALPQAGDALLGAQ